MNETLSSLLILSALVIPALIFMIRGPKLNAARTVHALMMAAICLFIGLLVSAAAITLIGVESQLTISVFVLAGSLIATASRLVWIRRFG